jgi:hypothetical protein
LRHASREHIALASDGSRCAMAHDSAGSEKLPYTTPKLTIHGTLQDITLMRFNWQGRREWPDGPIVNVS